MEQAAERPKSLGKKSLEKEVHVGVRALPESLAGHAYDQD